MDDQQILSSFPNLNENDLRVAAAYAAAHPSEIDREIVENEQD